jgi:hypothetical protein
MESCQSIKRLRDKKKNIQIWKFRTIKHLLVLPYQLRTVRKERQTEVSLYIKGKGHPITGHPGPRGGVEV